MAKKETRTLFIFYLLAIYVVLQFCWWAYLLVDLHGQVLGLKLHASDASFDGQSLEQKHNNKLWMILGEGMVFLIFLSLGIWKVQDNLKKEGRLVRLQQNFLLSVTHEIKSPIASVRLLLETLKKRKLDDEARMAILDSSLEETDRLDVLSDKILLAARIENQKEVLHPEEIDLGEEVRIKLERYSKTIASAHEVISEITDGLIIHADKQAIHSIFTNLFENACKYSSKGSVVRVEVNEISGAPALVVSDQGPGIEEEDKTRVFEKFFRSGDENTRTTKGTGLGLYIVRQLVDQMGAEISYSSNRPNGAIFTVKFRRNV